MNATKRRLLVPAVVTLASAALTGGVLAAHAATAASAGCRVDYTVTSQWQGGFGASVTVTNLGDALTSWTLAWSFGAGQSVTQAWNATVTQNGTAVTATNTAYNGSVATNGTVSFGFNGAWTTGNPVPASFTLNGTPCTGTPGVSPCPAPSTSRSASPSASPRPSATPQAKITIWLAGDSTMANPASGTTCPVGWGSQFAPYFTTNVTVKNNAVAGRSIQTWLYDPNVTSTMDSTGECVISPAAYSTRWQSMLDATTGMKAGDWLFVQFGINDSDPTCPRHVGTARYQQLLGVMAAAAAQRGVHAVFLTPVAAITCSGSTATGNRGFLTQTFNAGTAAGVPVIDLHTLSYTLYNTLGFCPNNGDYTQGAVGAFFCNDHTHFETAGAVQIANLVATAIRNQRLALAAYLR